MPLITYSQQNQIAILELRAPSGNAVSFAVLDELEQELQRAIDDPNVRGIVIHGGPERFSVGADLAIFQSIRAPEQAVHASRVFQEAFAKIENAPKPVLAAVAGHVLGGGLELAMSCHARLAVEGSRFSMPEVNLGINPGAGGTQRLPRLIGLDAALDMLLSARPIDAATALKLGLIDSTCPAGNLIETAVSLLCDDSGELARAMRDLNARRTGRQRDKLSDVQANRAVFAKFESGLSKVRAELVAPRKILQAVRVGVEESFESGLLCEQEMFRQCMESLATRNKIYVLCARMEMGTEFSGAMPTRAPDAVPTQNGAGGSGGHAVRANGAAACPPEPLTSPVFEGSLGARVGMAPGSKQRVPVPISAGVLGMGTMGTGIAQALLMAGLKVVACDQSEAAIKGAAGRIAEAFQRRVTQGKLPASKAQATLSQLTTTVDWSALAGAQLVIEAVFEDIEVKRAAIARLEEICPKETIIATNTSTLNLDALAAGMRHPERLIGLHFFHPAQQMPLVEVIRRDATPVEILAAAIGLAKAMGKTPVVCRNREGFVVNRLFVPYLTEAFWLLEEGASPEAIDRAMVEFGFAMGPLQLIDMSGIDILAKTQPILAKAFPYHGPLSRIVWELVEQEHLGQKTGAGVYQYAPGDRTPRPHAVLEEIVGRVRRDRCVPARKPEAPEIVERLMLRMVAEAYRLLDDGVVQRESDVDVAMVLGTGLADFRGGVLKYAADLGTEMVQNTLRRLEAQHGQRYGVASY